MSNDTIHSCHDDCQLPACVTHRAVRAVERELAEVTAERNGLAAFINDHCQMTAIDPRIEIVRRCIASAAKGDA